MPFGKKALDFVAAREKRERPPTRYHRKSGVLSLSQGGNIVEGGHCWVKREKNSLASKVDRKGEARARLGEIH